MPNLNDIAQAMASGAHMVHAINTVGVEQHGDVHVDPIRLESIVMHIEFEDGTSVRVTVEEESGA